MRPSGEMIVSLFGAGWTGQTTRVPAAARRIVGRGGHVFVRIAPNVAVWFGDRLQKANASAAEPREEKP